MNMQLAAVKSKCCHIIYNILYYRNYYYYQISTVKFGCKIIIIIFYIYFHNKQEKNDKVRKIITCYLL